ncbi:MAG: hypothetical protein KDC44_06340, partial [Phaeodactylibacter sp.]|nr:hypothetical protein [Phaeodactylibacter sp.]
MRNCTILWIGLACVACKQPPTVDACLEERVLLVSENSLFLLTEEMLRVFQEQVPDQTITCTYGTPAEIQALFLQGEAQLLLTTNPLSPAQQVYADTSQIEIVSEWLGRESLWYFGPRNQRDSLLCPETVIRKLSQTRHGLEALLLPGYPQQPLGLFESML